MWWLWPWVLAGCTPPTDDPPSAPVEQAWLAATPTEIRLPWVLEGGAAETVLELVSASSVTVSIEVEGPFEAVTQLEVMESTPLLIRLTPTEPGLYTGALTLSSNDDRARIELHAAVGVAGLPQEIAWQDVGGGLLAKTWLPSAPWAVPGGWSDPSVWIAVPHGLEPSGPVDVVTHLHGHGATLALTVPAQQLVEQFWLAGRRGVLVVPQGPVDAASGDFGQLMAPGGHANLVRDALSVAWRDGALGSAEVGRQAVTAHSGGYRAAAAAVTLGGLEIDVVHLFDALYAEEAAFAAHAQDGRLVSSWTVAGGTADNHAYLTTTLDGLGVPHGDHFGPEALLSERVVLGLTDATHSATPSDLRAFARWLRFSPLRPSAQHPPELKAVEAVDGGVRVRWWPEWDGEREVVAERSMDGDAWEEVALVDGIAAGDHPFLRLRAIHGETRSRPSDVYGATGDAWLVVDGFDRVSGGSWTAPTHDFSGRVGAALGLGVSVASHEAVAAGDVDLTPYEGLLWLLGDESTADRTFEPRERAIIEDWLQTGGKLVVSGSEVGYASGAWLSDILGVEYVADDAGTTLAGGYRFGVAYPEDFPDVLSADEVLWTYATGGGAAVGRRGRWVVVGFPLETLDANDLRPALAELLGWLE